MNNWKDLTHQVLETINQAHIRSRVGGHDQVLVRDLENRRSALEKIKTQYESGVLIPTVTVHEMPSFQVLVRDLKLHQVELKTGELASAMQNLQHYLRRFIYAGPHGPGGGEPYIESDGEGGPGDVGPHGGGGGEPGSHDSGKGEPSPGTHGGGGGEPG